MLTSKHQTKESIVLRKQQSSANRMIWQDGKGKSHSNCVVMATHKMDERTLKYFTYIKEEVAMSMDFIIMY